MTHSKTTFNTQQHHMDEKELPATLTADEAWKLVGKDKISRGGWYAAINRNEVPHRRLGRRILIPRLAFLRWLESAGQSGEPEEGAR
jgi:hypothetical protein